MFFSVSSRPGTSGITGAGATFPGPIYTKWVSEYNKLTGIQINYQPVGSGGGREQFIAGDEVTCPVLGSGAAARALPAADALMRDHAAKKKIVPFARDYGASDLAGAYAIQGRAARFIDRIEGSWSNVVGLPACEVITALVAGDIVASESHNGTLKTILTRSRERGRDGIRRRRPPRRSRRRPPRSRSGSARPRNEARSAARGDRAAGGSTPHRA